MNRDFIVPWLLQPLPIWIALAGGFVPGLIAAFKRRSMTLWCLYGFVCTLVAWPLLGIPTIHALLMRRHDIPRRFPRRADALALIADRSVQSYPSWIAELRRKSPTGIDRRRYAYERIEPGEALELVREPANPSNDHAVAYCHRGVHLGYAPQRQRWVAEALDDGLCLTAVAEDVKIGWISRRRSKFVGTRIVVINDGPRVQSARN